MYIYKYIYMVERSKTGSEGEGSRADDLSRVMLRQGLLDIPLWPGKLVN